MIEIPFSVGDEIHAPEAIITLANFEQLFLHVISHFYDEINAYGNREHLLSSIKSIIYEYIPAVYPQYLEDYPSSLDNIYALIAETVKINQENHDSLPEVYPYPSQEMKVNHEMKAAN